MGAAALGFMRRFQQTAGTERADQGRDCRLWAVAVWEAAFQRGSRRGLLLAPSLGSQVSRIVPGEKAESAFQVGRGRMFSPGGSAAGARAQVVLRVCAVPQPSAQNSLQAKVASLSWHILIRCRSKDLGVSAMGRSGVLCGNRQGGTQRGTVGAVRVRLTPGSPHRGRRWRVCP